MKKESFKNLSDYKDEIRHCSKCGICQSACPVYQVTGNECTVSRGQFIMLNGVLKGDLTLNKNINKYLDMCLKCNKCKDACPAEINPLDIILCAKSEYFKKSLFGNIYGFFQSKYIFNTALTIVEKVRGIFCKKIKSEKFDKKVVYFGGCMSKFDPETHNFIIKLLNKLQIEVLDIDFNCCGIPFLTTGNMRRFKEQLTENISKLPENFDYFITDCASCEWAWKEYVKYVDDAKLKEKLVNIKFKNIYEVIQENDITYKANSPLSITYHKPCHEKCEEVIINILKSIKNTEYKEMNGYDECCGFASFEFPQTLKLTRKIRERKKLSINNSGADVVITSCAGCGIALKLINPKVKVKRVISFIKDFCEIDE